MNQDKLFARIEKLFNVGILSKGRVLVAGCGSGGGSVAQKLVMSGLCNFTLIDRDTLKDENVIRHVCGCRYLGQPKVDALADVLLDRNPSAQIKKIQADLMELTNLNEIIDNHDVVVLATDNDPTRYKVNEECVRAQKPFVVGKVFTRGIGGEVFSFRPREGGCLSCLESILERTQFRSGIREVDLVSNEEREQLYGMTPEEIKDSPGLIVDIDFITAFHTRFVLDAIAAQLQERPKYMAAIPENYLVWGNRPTHPFKKNFEIQRITLKPQENCLICGES